MGVTPACVLTPAKEEGPYFVDERLLRSDIRSDSAGGARQDGAPLSLALRVVRADERCEALAGAFVDVWHCNAHGVYSDEPAEGTAGSNWLRGCQKTDEEGRALFETVVPGWYAGRAVHIHFKIRLIRDRDQRYEFTSQLFFDDALIRDLHTSRDPYRARGAPQLTNEEDPLFGEDGWRLVVPMAGDADGGYVATMAVGLAGLPAA